MMNASHTTRDGRHIRMDMAGGTNLSEQEVRDLAEMYVHMLDLMIESGHGVVNSSSNEVVLPNGMKNVFHSELSRSGVIIKEFGEVSGEPGKIRFVIKRQAY
jgi:hypothetical protein